MQSPIADENKVKSAMDTLAEAVEEYRYLQKEVYALKELTRSLAFAIARNAAVGIHLLDDVLTEEELEVIYELAFSDRLVSTFCGRAYLKDESGRLRKFDKDLLREIMGARKAT